MEPKITRTTRITIETESTVLVRQSRTQVCLPSLVACSQANEVTRIQTPERSLPAPGRSPAQKENDDDTFQLD